MATDNEDDPRSTTTVTVTTNIGDEQVTFETEVTEPDIDQDDVNTLFAEMEGESAGLGGWLQGFGLSPPPPVDEDESPRLGVRRGPARGLRGSVPVRSRHLADGPQTRGGRSNRTLRPRR